MFRFQIYSMKLFVQFLYPRLIARCFYLYLNQILHVMHWILGVPSFLWNITCIQIDLPRGPRRKEVHVYGEGFIIKFFLLNFVKFVINVLKRPWKSFYSKKNMKFVWNLKQISNDSEYYTHSNEYQASYQYDGIAMSVGRAIPIKAVCQGTSTTHRKPRKHSKLYRA